MKRFPFVLAMLGLLALSASAGCGGPSQLGLNAASRTLRIPARRTSWISPDAKQAPELLFESDPGYDSVEMFSLPDLKRKGVITGIEGGVGMCSDSSGDVYVVTQLYPFEAIELSHAGKILRTVSDFDAYPAGCAVNPRNGDLAIGNIQGNSQPGMVSLYPGGASGYARWLRCTALTAYYFVGYDPHGDIFVDGEDDAGHFHLCRGRDGDDTLSEVKISGVTINAPGMIAWYAPGKYLAVGDPHCTGSNTSCIYKVSISGESGRVIGSTKPLLSNGSPLCDLVQGAIDPDGGTLLLGGNNPTGCGSQEPSIDEWPYPAGGRPSKHYTNSNFINEPFGAAVSERSSDSRSEDSKMQRGAKNEDLLYVSDPPLVRIYGYPKTKLVGTIKPTPFVLGMCTNPTNGDVFFVELKTIAEYAHGGTMPIRTLNYPDENPESCAVDPSSGNLAVTNSYPPALYVYTNASGIPKMYGAPPSVGQAIDCVYDDRGNLFVTGFGDSKGFVFGELSRIGDVFTVSLGATATIPSATAGVQWDGTDVVLSDGAEYLYRFKILRHKGRLAGKAMLENAANVSNIWLEGDQLIVPNSAPYGKGDVAFYAYPAGGRPVKTMTGFARPTGAVVSVAPK